MADEGQDTAGQIARALRLPFTPQPLRALAAAEGYLDAVWPQIAPSVDTAGFLGSARYMVDMALDAVEATYEPVLSPASLLATGAIGPPDREALAATVDLFHYTQPQLLLLLAALAEALERERVGGRGSADPRPVTDRERGHLALRVVLIEADTAPLPAIVEALGLDHAPDLYRAVAAWPGYLAAAWDELQHLAAYPDFRRRGRALYFYARSGARFLARPVEANPAALRRAGVSESAIATARRALDAALPATAMMMMHAEAMRVGLGIRDREVVTG